MKAFIVLGGIFLFVLLLVMILIKYIITTHADWSVHKHTYRVMQKSNGEAFLKRRFLFYFWRKYRVGGVVECFEDTYLAEKYANQLPTYFRTEDKDKEVCKV